MADLRVVAGEAGFRGVQTYIQSGNLVVEAKGTSGKAVEAKLEGGILARFGFPVDVVVRTADEWAAMAAGNPFRAISTAEGNHVMMLVSKAAPRQSAAAGLLASAAGGEQVAAAPGAVWVYYPEGAGKTKLTPALVDRVVGSKVTARNWRTVVKLLEMAASPL